MLFMVLPQGWQYNNCNCVLFCFHELFSRFILCSTLVPRANAFLRERSIYDVVKCETLEKKVSSPEQLGQSNPKFDVPSAIKSVYVVKGLR